MWSKNKPTKTFVIEGKKTSKRLKIAKRKAQKIFALLLVACRRICLVLLKAMAFIIVFTDIKLVKPSTKWLSEHSALLRKWQALKYRPQIRSGLLLFATFFIASVFIQSGLRAAPDLSDAWDLSNPSDYDYSSGIEMVSGVVRLKAQNYTDDANTAGLFHFDESGGSAITDGSSNGNNGTLSGGSFASGNLNNAVQLDGVDDGITVPNSVSLQLGQQHSIEGWTKFNSTFSAGSSDRRNAIVDKGDYQVYFDNETGKLTYELYNENTTNWSQAGGGWEVASKRSVSSSVTVGTNVYAGLGNVTGDAEVWRWNGTSWTKIGGDGLNGSWSDGTFEEVTSLVADGTEVYAGLGNTAGDAEVWRWNGTSWTKIGGDAINSSWQVNTFENVPSMYHDGTNLYAGLGSSANDAEVWRWNGTSWTKIGGDSLNSGWTTNYEAVYALAGDGTNLYAGLGSSANDAEVWRWNGTSWTKIGGDSLNSGWTTNYESVRSLVLHSGTLFAGLGDSAGDAEVWRWNGTSWTKIGGDSLNSSWDSTIEAVYSLAHDGTTLYAGLGNSNGDGDVYSFNGSSWTKIGGDDLNGSWLTNSGDYVLSLSSGVGKIFATTYDTAGGGYLYEWNGSTWNALAGQHINNSWGYYGLGSVEVLQVAGEYLYAGLGAATGSAQVWRTDGENGWELVGGQGTNGSWDINTYEYISSMSSHDGDLYAGLGNGAGDAEVWRWDGSGWNKIGGDGLNSSWGSGYERVSALAVLSGDLYVGLGSGAGDAEVWRWNGSLWQKIGGDGLTASWDSSFEQIQSMIPFANKLLIGLGTSTDDAEVWEYDGSSWTKIGGDDVNGSWLAGTYETVKTLAVYSGDLYAGLGNGTGDGEVWRFDGASWTKIGGNGQNGSWGNTIEEVRAFSAFKGRLYAGTGGTANADANVWTWGDNGYLQSTIDSFDSNWRHIAVTYNGSEMQIFINGSLDASVSRLLTVGQRDKDLFIGNSYGGREYGKPLARFEGMLDEIRLSDTVRSSFTTLPYSDERQTVSPKDSVRPNGVWHWDVLDDVATLNGGSVNYRLSNDNGATWLYWNGLDWVESNSLAQNSSKLVITTNFESFPVTFSGFKWQAVLLGDGDQQVILDSVDAQATSDLIDPNANPSDIKAYKSNGGAEFFANDWTNGASPYFEWTTGDDDESGVLGYCLYLGADSAGDPITTKGLLGNSPTNTGNNCQFMVTSENIDLATAGYLQTALTSSDSTYYLNIRTIDIAGNVTSSSEQFAFRFDNTPPTNPGFITAPSGFINTRDVTLTWPTTGGSAPTDTNSGLVGLQYRIGPSGTWYGDAHSGLGDINDVLANDGSYRTVDPLDYDNLLEGINTIYFRAWDAAGNVTSTYTTATIKINTSGAPSEPTNVSATPTTNTVNSFGFNWDAPSTFVGDVNNITYCYTVNVVPSVASCVYTAPGSTELTIGAYATQPGTNTMYVVARDESSNINYSNYASVDFTANTTAPGIPLNTDIVDVSIKATNNWRLALTWEQPTAVGGGINAYKVYRSTDNTNFTQVGSSSSTTYIDAGLSQQTYYYKVAACDNTNNCGAYGATVNGYPTGKFTTPAGLTSQPEVSGITTKRATISWTTDRTSDSKIALGTKSGNYSPSEIGNSTQVTAHEIKLDNLAPGTTYYYVAKWTDEDGNTGQSGEKTFTTSPAPSIKEVEVSEIRLDGARIEFTTKGATKAKVYYGTSESFGGLATVNTSTQESRYSVQLNNLQDGAKYFYMVSTIDAEGDEYKGNIASFSTPPRPRITNLRFQPVEGEPTSTQRVTWQTNVASSSQVTYGIIGEPTLEKQDSKLVTDHEIIIKDLKDDSQYTLVAQSRDEAGNVATSDQQVFKTALDTRPPEISDIVVEASIRGTGSEARGQIVVSWKTDEPATSQVAYTEGTGAVTFNSKTAEDVQLTKEHLVIISDLPTSRVFSIQPISSDKAKNEGTGSVETAIIGRASDSVLTIVFNTLRGIFGL
jgi:hypothetical protein